MRNKPIIDDMTIGEAMAYVHWRQPQRSNERRGWADMNYRRQYLYRQEEQRL
jgi:hypothetical protein